MKATISPAGSIIDTLQGLSGDDDARAQYVILMRVYRDGLVHANDLHDLHVADRAKTIPAAFAELSGLGWIKPFGVRIRSVASHQLTHVWELTGRGAVAAVRFAEDFTAMESTEARRAA